MLYGGEDIGAIVFDLGSQSFRIGSAQDDGPKSEIPSMVGILNEGIPDTSVLEPGATSGKRINGNTKYFTDITSLRVPRKGKLNYYINIYLGILNIYVIYEISIA